MWRDALPSGEGLFIPGTGSIHMLFMRFPIDCLFVGRPDATGRRAVVGVRHRLPAWRGVVWYVRRADGVVELPAGTLTAASVREGDVVRLEPASEGGGA